MPIEVVLPKVDMDMESGVIAVWKVAEGDLVREGDVLFEMETDKSVMEVESPGTGTIRGLAGITGEPVAVGTAVAWIDADAPAMPAKTAGLDVDGKAAPAPAIAAATTAAIAPAPAPQAGATTDGATTDGATTDGATSDGASGAELRATPSARRTARLFGVDLAAVTGSGPRGRIVAQDLEAYVDARDKAQPSGMPDAGPGATNPKQTDPMSSTVGELVPFNPVRRIVAQRLADSVRNAPHFYLNAQIEMTALQGALRRLGPGILKATGVKLSITLLLARIVGHVLPHHPLVNASIEGEGARLHPDVNIGIAMDRDGDLVVPVLRNVQGLSLQELATEFGRLRQAVLMRSIAPSEMRGGTFTISNLGMYEVDAFTAIINQRESAILAIGRIVDTPVGRDGQVVLRPMATMTLSSDHRIVDGITAARFMAQLRKAIEDPSALR